MGTPGLTAAGAGGKLPGWPTRLDAGRAHNARVRRRQGWSLRQTGRRRPGAFAASCEYRFDASWQGFSSAVQGGGDRMAELRGGVDALTRRVDEIEEYRTSLELWASGS